MSSYDYNFTGSPELNKLILMPLVFDNTKCTGIVKLAQRVVVLFLKDKNSSFSQEVGTNILELFGTGNMLANGEVDNLLTLAGNSVREAIQNSTSSDTPEDEQLKDLKITFEKDLVNRTSLLIKIKVQSVSGITVTAATNLKLAG
jgi:hypothetical protein